LSGGDGIAFEALIDADESGQDGAMVADAEAVDASWVLGHFEAGLAFPGIG
jgi:hypothetical protein